MIEREFVESIRQDYSGLRDSPRVSLANSIRTLADDLYAKDTHFIFELIQNAEDNDYEPNRKPNLRFEVCLQEIDGGFSPVLIVHNNETGFREKHVQALCRVGESTKKKAQGYIGEKGIGFKSVFRITECPYVFSNGFQFCLPKDDEETRLGYIVPRWVADPPVGVVKTETTIILPISGGDEGVQKVVDALYDIAPETILFLEKLESIEISVHLPDNEYEVVIEKRIQAVSGESKQVELTFLKRNGADDEVLENSLYWVTEVEFPRPADVQHEKRAGIESRTVSVAIPLGPNAHGGKLFAYLPVRDDTGLPFLINADFVLVSSREGIREDEAWNKWLRDCIEETYVRAFLSLLNAPALSEGTKISAYGSIPLETHWPFLAPVRKPVWRNLESQDCVLVLPDGSLVKPSRARLCDRNFRAVLGSSDCFPLYLRSDVRLVDSELEKYSSQLKAIGVEGLLPSEIVSCLQDIAWVKEHELPWFIDLLRYLSTRKLDPADLRNLAILPIAHAAQEAQRLSCDIEQPIYFSRTEADREALAHVPPWLSEFVPVAFLDSEFLGLLDQQADPDALREWMRKALNVYSFSTENYCVDILSKLMVCYTDIKDDRLVEATAFLAQHAGSKFNWELLPIILSNGQRLLLRDARKQFRDIVVPEDFDAEAGWQHIWSAPQDRTHFLALASGYRSMPLTWFDQRQIKRYPGFRFSDLDIRGIGYQLIKSPEYEFFHECQKKAASAHADNTHVYSYVVPTSLAGDLQISDPLSRSLLSMMQTLDVPSDAPINVDNMHRLGFRAKGVYHYYGENTAYCDSYLLQKLRTLKWLPSSKGLVAPSDACLPKQGIKEIFGDTIPYFEGNLPGNIQSLLRIQSDITVDDLLALLRKASRNAEASLDYTERIYSQLFARTRYYQHDDVPTRFASEALILIKDNQQKAIWCKTTECVWEDASAALGDDFAYLAGQYPKLQDFFVDRLGVKRRVDPECYAQRWLRLQEDPLLNVQERRALVERIYREIRPIAMQSEADRPAWWRSFSKSLKVYTHSDTFEPPARVVLPDDGTYRKIFQGDSVAFAWRPEKDAFGEWAPFYRALGTPLLSETVTEHLEDDTVYEGRTANQFVTEAAVKMIAAWLRERQKNDFERLLRDESFARLASLREARTSSDIKVEFRLGVSTGVVSRTATYPVFWKRSDNILICTDDVKESQVAKAIAKGLLENRAYRELADWIELVLGARETERLRDADWNVPQPILDLFTKSASAASLSGVPPLPERTTPPHVRDEALTSADPSGAASSSQSPALNQSDVPIEASGAERPPKAPRSPASDGRQPREACHGSGGAHQPDRAEPSEHAEPQVSRQGTGNHHDSEGFNYLDELLKAFNRDGVMHVDDGELEWDPAGDGTVKNPRRRRTKLEEGYQEAIDNEPPPEDRRRVTERSLLEGPNEAVRVALHEWYRGKCQICGETWPEHDGRPYFAAAYLVERRHARWIDEPGNAICLCAEHFAQWRHAAKETPLDVGEQIHSLRLRAEGGNGNLSIDFTLLGKDVAISYHEHHLLELRTLVDVADSVADNRV
jgi:hypothetical protein